MSKRSRRAAHTRSNPPSVGDTPTSARRLLLIVFVVAAIVRIALAARFWELPIIRTPKLDSLEYVSWAQQLAAGDFSWPVVAQHGPGYPLFLAALLVVFGSLHAALFVQAIVGAATATLVAATGREIAGDRAGLFAGLFYAVFGPVAWVETSFLSEGLLLFLLTAALFALCRAPLTVRRAATAGAAFGAAGLVRPTALVVGAACAVWVVMSVRKRQRDAPILSAALVGATLLVIAPAVVRGWTASHSLSIQGYGGLNFYIGNSPLHDGRATMRLGAGWDALNSEAARAGIADPASQDRYYVSKTIAEIRQHPAAFARLLASKALWLLQAEESRDSHSYYFFADQSVLLRVLPRMAILLVFAAIGIVPLARLRPRSTVVFCVGAAAAATSILLVVGTRYRMPLVPVLAICAGMGLETLIAGLITRDTRRIAVCAAAAAAAIVVSHLLGDPRNHNLAEEWAFTGSSLITERDFAGAETAYRQALAIDPTAGLAWDGLGLVKYDSDQLSAARDAFARARALDPDSARAAYHLGLIAEREGRLPDAIAEYTRADSLSPFDLDVARHLGSALVMAQRPSDALPHLRTVMAHAPDDARSQYALATALGMSGATADARAAMRHAVELAPSNAEAWLDLCLLSMDAHDTATAAAALQRARELGASPQRLAVAAAALNRAGGR